MDSEKTVKPEEVSEEPAAVTETVEKVAETVEAPAAEAAAPAAEDKPQKAPYRANNANRKRKKVCQFCVEKAKEIDFKDVGKLKKFTSERGKILPRRVTGACAMHQRHLTTAIKRARTMALLPYTTD